jgi:hypothetical protein
MGAQERDGQRQHGGVVGFLACGESGRARPPARGWRRTCAAEKGARRSAEDADGSQRGWIEIWVNWGRILGCFFGFEGGGIPPSAAVRRGTASSGGSGGRWAR